MKLFSLKSFGGRIVKLLPGAHWHEEWVVIVGHNAMVPGKKKVLNPKLIAWATANKIKYVHYAWKDQVYMFFLKQGDAVLFRLTWR